MSLAAAPTPKAADRPASWGEAVATNAICNASINAAGLLSPASRVSGSLSVSLGATVARAATYHFRRSAVYITSARLLSSTGIAPGAAVGASMAATMAMHSVGRPTGRSLLSAASLTGVEWTLYLKLRNRFEIAGSPLKGAVGGAAATALATTLVLPVTTGLRPRALVQTRTLQQLGKKAAESAKQSSMWYFLYESLKGLSKRLHAKEPAAGSRPGVHAPEKPAEMSRQADLAKPGGRERANLSLFSQPRWEEEAVTTVARECTFDDPSVGVELAHLNLASLFLS